MTDDNSEPQREVVDTRDVSDVPEDTVDDAVDQMLQGKDPDVESGDLADVTEDTDTDTDTVSASETDSEPTFTESSEPDLSEMDPAEIDPAQLEEQEWTLGEEQGRELIDFNGTTFLLGEPNEDRILDIIGQQPGESVSASKNMRELCQETIIAPKITDDRWDGLNLGERLGLMMEVSQYVGINEFMDFQEIGAEAQPGT